MEKVIETIRNVKTNVDIIGNIFICDELCNISFNYKPHNNIILKNDSKNIYLNYNGNSFVNYNGGEEFGSVERKYYLKKIMFQYPAKHFIKSHRNDKAIELFLIHQDGNSERFQNISILLYPTESIKAKSTVQYKLFERFMDNIPSVIKESSSVNVDNWNVEDFLPNEGDRSFYTYNNPFDAGLVNYIVFQTPVDIPMNFFVNYLKSLKITSKKQQQLLNESPVPKNPPTLILYARKDIKDVYDPEKIKERKTAIKSEKTGEKCECPINSTKENSDNKEKIVEEGKKTKEKNKEDDGIIYIHTGKKKDIEPKVEENKIESEDWKWWQIILILLGIIIVVVIIVLIIIWYYGWEMVKENIINIFENLGILTFFKGIYESLTQNVVDIEKAIEEQNIKSNETVPEKSNEIILPNIEKVEPNISSKSLDEKFSDPFTTTDEERDKRVIESLGKLSKLKNKGYGNEIKDKKREILNKSGKTYRGLTNKEIGKLDKSNIDKHLKNIDLVEKSGVANDIDKALKEKLEMRKQKLEQSAENLDSSATRVLFGID